jgi:hypothetical protein
MLSNKIDYYINMPKQVSYFLTCRNNQICPTAKLETEIARKVACDICVKQMSIKHAGDTVAKVFSGLEEEEK